jgi:hypothetical protein
MKREKFYKKIFTIRLLEERTESLLIRKELFGTIHPCIEQGAVSERITSRDEISDTSRRQKQIKNLKEQIIQANKVLGAKKVFIFNFPDNIFDTIALLAIELNAKMQSMKTDMDINEVFNLVRSTI